jgi:hypothetical protein
MKPVRFCCLLLCLTAASSLASCTKTFVIELPSRISSDAGFSRPGFLWDTRFDPCLKWFALYDENSRREVWRISAAGGTCVTIHAIRLGEVPHGFREASALVFVPGHIYSAAAEEEDGTLGSSESRILE